MTAEQISKIGAFMQFERKTYEQQGIGMGLKLAKQTVESYGDYSQFPVSINRKQRYTLPYPLPILDTQVGDQLMRFHRACRFSTLTVNQLAEYQVFSL